MTAAWHESFPWAPWDSETTGLDVEQDRIVTACVGLLRPATPKWDVQIKSWLIDPQVEIPEAATAVHGVTTQYAKENGQPPAEGLDLIAAELALALAAGFPLVGANLTYDNTLVDRELRRYGLPTIAERISRPVGPCIDVLVIDRAIDRYRPGKRTLTDLCGTYGVRIDGAHDSTFDALAAARVAYAIGLRCRMPDGRLCALYADRRYPDRIVKAFRELGEMTLPELHDAQILWYREQAENFAQYLRTQANELRHNVTKATDADDFDKAAQLRQDLADLEARIDGMSYEWPLAEHKGGAA